MDRRQVGQRSLLCILLAIAIGAHTAVADATDSHDLINVEGSVLTQYWGSQKSDSGMLLLGLGLTGLADARVRSTTVPR